MSISNIGGGFGYEALRGPATTPGTPLLGQSPVSAPVVPSAGSADQATLSPELSESEGGANALLAAWGANKSSATPPALTVQGVDPGPKTGFSVTGGQVGGLEPGAQAGGVMLGPVLRA